ncbi:MAG TPA: helix-turn-helix transcriptional regulator [Tepidisphaeraceae bacterium]|nr:helix-turn-helix transcriptional regulator [Tepidisphaeraceae bacterium]
MTFTEKLRRLMKMHRPKMVAQVAGVSRATMAALVAGKHQPMIGTANAIARAVGVDVGWLIDDTRDWPPVRTTPAMDRELETNAA